MLVLERVTGSQILMIVPPSDKPRKITVTTVRLRKNKVILGVDADRDVDVARAEVYDAERAEGHRRETLTRKETT